MNYKHIIIIFFSSLAITSCGGGGGGGSSTPIAGSGSSAPTYSYDRVSANYNGKSWDSSSQMRRARQDGLATGYAGFTDYPSNISITEYSNYIDITIEGSTNGNSNTSINYSFDLTNTNTTSDPLYNADNEVVAYLFGTSFSNATLYGFVFDTDALSSYNSIDYTNVGFLDFIFSDGTRDTFAFNYGDLTDSGDMPTTGTASYELGSYMIFNAFVQGEGRYSSNEDISIVSQGEGTLTANFGTNVVEGSIDFDQYYSYFGFLNYGADAQSQILNVPTTQLTLSGSMSSSSFGGNATLQGGGVYGTGNFQGSFFGNNANEVSGTFLIGRDSDQDTSGADYWDVVGTFIGCESTGC